MVIKNTGLGRRMDEHSENFNKEVQNIRKYQIKVTELKNTTEMKNILEGSKRRLDEAEASVYSKTRQGNSSNQSSKKI